MKAGIKRNDIIKSVNGLVSTSEIRFTDLTYNLFPGDEVELEIHDRLRSKSYKLAASLDKSSYSNLMLSRAYLGIGLAVVTGSTREKMALLNRSGELVVSVRENSPADKAGLLVGAVVLSVNGIHLSQDMGDFDLKRGFESKN